MKLPFFGFRKKSKPAKKSSTAASAPVAAIEKPASERLGKTVMPNVSRVGGPEPARPSSSSVPAPSAPATARASVGPRSISLGGNRPGSATPAAPRAMSLGANHPGAATLKPARREIVTSPAVARTIALPLSDLLPEIPAGLVRGSGVDPEQRLLLQASEIERGMANGRPTVPLRSIYQQAPQIFATEVSPDDSREVPLPFAKVLEQFTSFQIRGDQVQDESVPQVETPFLKVTVEDSERFGTTLPPVHTTELFPVVVHPPTAEAIAAAEPEPALKSQPRVPIRLGVPKEAAAGSSADVPIRLDQLAAPPPVAPKMSPKGTGVPATERVPASSGPPVPTPSSATVATAAPVRIPFKIIAPSNEVREPFPTQISSTSNENESLGFSSIGPRIQLSLRSVLRGVPPFQLNGAIEDVPEEARIELPFSIVEPQLSLGRVAISPAQFHLAMPEAYRPLFKLDEGGLPVSLPLPEVLQNLPNELLQLRPDQEETEIAGTFETPFSQKAAEDAARMNVPAGPIAKGALSPIPTVTEEKDKAKKGEEEKAASPGRTPLQIALDTDDELDAKAIVAHASRLPGVRACAIVFADGLSLAGNIPADYGAEALCAMAPSIVKRIDDQMAGSKLGSLHGVTLFCAKAPVSLFAHGNICLAALHSAGEIAAEIRDRLGRTAQELARMYSQPA